MRLDKLAALNLTSFIPAAAMSMQVRDVFNTRVKHPLHAGENQGRSSTLQRPCPCEPSLVRRTDGAEKNLHRARRNPAG